MSVDDVSFAINALKVRGFPVMANTKRPPCLPSDGASTTSGSSGSGCGSLYSATSAARRRQPVTIASIKTIDRKSTRLNSSHSQISYAVFCLKKKKKNTNSQLLDTLLALRLSVQ